MELFWRALARTSIDRCRPPVSALGRLKKTTFTLSDIQTIVGRKVSLGELIAASYSFQGTTALNAAFSEILQINVFSEFAKQEFVIVEAEWYKLVTAAAAAGSVEPLKSWTSKREPLKRIITGRDILKRDCELVDRCCAIRHDSVHSSGQGYPVKANETVRIANAVWEFNMVLGMFIESRFDALWSPA